MWSVKYHDNTGLKQYEGIKESLFRDIFQDKLSEFIISENGLYSVNLVTGEFDLNGLKLNFPEANSGAKFRLIYFRRVRHTIGEEEDNPETKEYFGYQVTIKGRNIKRIIMIDKGKVVIQD